MGRRLDRPDHIGRDEIWLRTAVVLALVAGAAALGEIVYLFVRLFVG